jgi:hypothetical protein
MAVDKAIGPSRLSPGNNAVEVAANLRITFFIGSTLERMTLVHHC